MSAHVYHQMYFHIVWSTKDRLPFIVDDVREWLVKRVASEACKRNAEVLACNAMPDHVHLFVSLPPTVTPATFVGEVKGTVSHAFHRKYGDTRFLKWQMGYSILTLRKNEQEIVTRYIEDQQLRHGTGKYGPPWNPSTNLRKRPEKARSFPINLQIQNTSNQPSPIHGAFKRQAARLRAAFRAAQ
ncbi:MAG: transposase IS200-family protein [Chthonomonadaceae bacterium]|nr:transposase IS200-family protein [Chthonomonadaceae bacterium]